MANGASSADDTESHYNLTSHATSQELLQKARSLKKSAYQNPTVMAQHPRSSSSLPAVADSPHLPTKGDVPDLPIQPPSPESNSKRPREENGDSNGASPVSKKLAVEAETNINAHTAMNNSSAGLHSPSREPLRHNVQAVEEDDESLSKPAILPVVVTGETTANDDAVAPAGLEESIERSKVMNKFTAASGRRRACATCKRRKVKCKHNLAEEEVLDEGRLEQDSNIRKPTTTAKGSKKVAKTAQPDMETLTDRDSATNQTVAQAEGVEHQEEPVEEEPPKKAKAKKKAAPKKPTAPPERTSTRNRKAPERFESLEEQKPVRASPVKKSTSRVFDPVYITTNSTSRLGKADMYHMLLEDAAWTSLSSEQQVTLISMLPTTAENQQLLARTKAGETNDTRPQAFGKSNTCFRTDVAKFQEDLRNGHLAKTWQAAAEQAVIERAAGEYDAWKAEEAELWWGQKSK